MANRSDDFNRADSASLGTPSDGGSAWVVGAGAWGISGNRAVPSGSGAKPAYLETSSSDGEIQVTLSTQADYPGILFRYSDVNNYWFVYLVGNHVHICKNQAGTESDPAFAGWINDTFVPADGDVWKVNFTGAVITVYRNGSQVLQKTDAGGFNRTETKHGLYAVSSGASQWDDFSFTAAASMAPDKATVLNGASGTLTLTLTGTGTSWGGGTTFSLSATPTGWSVASQVVNSTTSATLTLNRGTGTGTLTVSDGSLSASATVTDTATTTAAGNWGTAANWDTLEVPTTHKAVVAHDVDVAASASVGTSPAAGTTVLTINSGKTLTVKSGVTFAVKGDTLCTGNLYVGETGGGATFVFDASGASSPSSQNYKVQLNSETATFRTRGSSGSHTTIRSHAGGGNGYTVNDIGKGLWDCEWTDFPTVGDATTDAISIVNNTNPAPGTTWLILTDCSFGGRVNSVIAFPSNARWELTRVRGQSCRLIGGDGTSTITDSSFADTLYTTPATVTLSGVMFGAGLDHANDSTWLDIAGCVFWADDVGSGAFSLRGNVADAYFYAGGTDNPHFPIIRDVGSARTVLRGVVDYGGGFLTDTGNAFYGSGDWTFENTIILPSGQDPSVASGAITGVGYKVRHCTLHSPGYTGGILNGDGAASSTGDYPQVKSNLFWCRNADADGVAFYVIGTPGTNPATPAAVVNNGLVNIAATAYQGTYPTTQPGSNDVRLDNTSETAVFVDPFRNVATWAVTRGSVAGTYAGKVADAKAYLLADPTIIPDLLAHVRGGFVVKNVSLKDAGHDGVTIGAMPFVTPVPAGVTVTLDAEASAVVSVTGSLPNVAVTGAAVTNNSGA